MLRHCNLISWDLCSLLAYKRTLSANVLEEDSILIHLKTPLAFLCAVVYVIKGKLKIWVDTFLFFYDVAAGFFGVRPDLGRWNVLVPVQQARSVLGGVSEATRTYGAGPEKERQSAETRWMARHQPDMLNASLPWECFKPVLIIRNILKTNSQAHLS